MSQPGCHDHQPHNCGWAAITSTKMGITIKSEQVQPMKDGSYAPPCVLFDCF